MTQIIFLNQGLSQFFPFSYSKLEILQIVKKLRKTLNATRGMIVSGFNPSVEEHRSHNFLINFLHSILALKD